MLWNVNVCCGGAELSWQFDIFCLYLWVVIRKEKAETRRILSRNAHGRHFQFNFLLLTPKNSFIFIWEFLVPIRPIHPLGIYWSNAGIYCVQPLLKSINNLYFRGELKAEWSKLWKWRVSFLCFIIFFIYTKHFYFPINRFITLSLIFVFIIKGHL